MDILLRTDDHTAELIVPLECCISSLQHLINRTLAIIPVTYSNYFVAIKDENGTLRETTRHQFQLLYTPTFSNLSLAISMTPSYSLGI